MIMFLFPFLVDEVSIEDLLDGFEDVLSLLMCCKVVSSGVQLNVVLPPYIHTPHVDSSVLCDLSLCTAEKNIVVAGDGTYVMSRYREKSPGLLFLVVKIGDTLYTLFNDTLKVVYGVPVGRYLLNGTTYMSLDDLKVPKTFSFDGLVVSSIRAPPWRLFCRDFQQCVFAGIIVLISGHQYVFNNSRCQDLVILDIDNYGYADAHFNIRPGFETDIGVVRQGSCKTLSVGDFVRVDVTTKVVKRKLDFIPWCFSYELGLQDAPPLWMWISGLFIYRNLFCEGRVIPKDTLGTSLESVVDPFKHCRLVVKSTPHFFVPNSVDFACFGRDLATGCVFYKQGSLVCYGLRSSIPALCVTDSSSNGAMSFLAPYPFYDFKKTFCFLLLKDRHTLTWWFMVKGSFIRFVIYPVPLTHDFLSILRARISVVGLVLDSPDLVFFKEVDRGPYVEVYYVGFFVGAPLPFMQPFSKLSFVKFGD